MRKWWLQSLVLAGCVLAAALTPVLAGCGKSQPPVGKWEGGYESGGDLVAARLEMLRIQP